MLSVRLFFTKKGMVRYISHLDLSRAMTRALVRTGLDIGYTEGYNPHVKLVFAQPLSIFQESDYEVADFRIDNDEIGFDEVAERLSATLPKGIGVIRAAAPVMKIGDCAFARYSVELGIRLADSEIAEKLSGSMMVNKRTKSGEKETDISDMIASASVSGGVIDAVVCAAPDRCLNPAYIAEYFGVVPGAAKITRKGLYNADMRLFE